MKSMSIAILGFCLLAASAFAAPKSQIEELGSNTVVFKSANPTASIDNLVGNFKTVFDAYQPNMDNSTKVLVPAKIGGTNTNPTLHMVVKKCIFLICETVEFNVAVSVQNSQGACPRNFIVTADMSRSSAVLSDNYPKMLIGICAQPASPESQATLRFVAERGPRFKSGMIQGEILNILRLQVTPISLAIGTALKTTSTQVRFR